MLTKKQVTNIKIALLRQDKTQIELAKEIGVSRQYLNGILARNIENIERERQLLKWLVDNM